MTERPMLTLREAADATGVSRRTIRRYLDEEAFPNATQDDDARGTWRIPVEDLLGAGLSLHASAPEADTAPAPDELVKLRTERDTWRRRAEVAEAIAEERGAALEDTRLALRALMPAPQDRAEEAKTRRGLFRR